MASSMSRYARTMPTGSGGGAPPTEYRQPNPNAPTYGNIPGGRQEYYGDPNARYQHTPGSSRGQQGAFRPPSQPTSNVAHATPFFDQQHAGDVQRRSDLLAGNDAYQQAKAAGDMRGQIAAMTQMKQDMQRQRFIDQGGQGSTWDNRFSNENNWPRPTSSIGYSHGPGRPDYATRTTNPSPYGPGNTAPPMQGGGPPPARAMGGAQPEPAMMPGGRYGGAGVPQGPGGFSQYGGGASTGQSGLDASRPMGAPNFGGGPYGGGGMSDWARAMNDNPMGYNPNQSKSGMGQSPMDFNRPDFGNLGPGAMGGGNPFASTGGDTGMYDPMMTQGRGFDGGFLPPGFGQGGRQPYNPYQPQPFNPDTRAGSAPAWAQQWGGMQPGWAPFDQGGYSMPYDMSGMGQW